MRGPFGTVGLVTLFFANEAVAAAVGATAAYVALRAALIPLFAAVNVFAQVWAWARGDTSRGSIVVRSVYVLVSLATWWFQWFYSAPLFPWS
jgi:hypothetical protein